MKHIKNILSVAALAAAMNCNFNLRAASMPTAFTYQGALNLGASPANGNYDFEFRLADAPSNSVPFASQVHYAVPVSNGVFTALPDFGSGYFTGDPRWLEIAVRASGSNSNFITLLPRTPLSPTPHALLAERARTADVATSAAGLSLPLAINHDHPNPLLQVVNGTGPALWAESTNSAAVVAVNNGPGNALFAANAGGGPSAIILGGNVGIGTQMPGEKLSVNGVIESKQGGIKFPDGTVQFTAGQTSAPPPQIWLLTGQSDAYRESGRIGIGTSAPEADLHVSKPVDQPLRLRVQTSRLTAGAMQKSTNFPSGARVALSGQTWSNPHLAQASDNQRSEVNLSGSKGGLDFLASQYLVLTNFGFSLPTNVAIANIAVQIEAKGTGTSPGTWPLMFVSASLLKGATAGSRVAWTDYLSATDFTHVLEGTSANWGLNLTPTAISQPDFGIRIATELSFWVEGFWGWESVDADGSGTVSIDSISITVHYYEPESVTQPVNFVVGVPAESDALRIMPGGDFTNVSGLYLNTNGTVGIGKLPVEDSFNLRLDVNGRIRAHDVTETSSRRYKEDVRPLENALATLNQLQGVSYRWDAAHGGRTDIGFIAEEVGRVLPDIVDFEPDGKNASGFNYGRLNALTVEAIKELHAALREKDAQLRALADEVKALKETRAGK